MSPARPPVILGGFAVAFFLAVVFTPLANGLSQRLAARARLEPAEAIVVLASSIATDGTLADSSLRRALRGIVLHRQGLAPLLVVSGIRLLDGPSEAQVRAELARTLGVPGEAVLIIDDAKTTRQEALEVAARLRPRGIRRILLVSDSQHLVRARGLFERAGFEVLDAPADRISTASTAPAARLELMQAALQELVGQLYYRLAGYL